VRNANQIETLGALLAGNFEAAYIALFIIFAALEAWFSKGRDPGSEAPGRLVVNFSLPVLMALMALVIRVGVTSSAILAEQRQWGLFHQIEAPTIVILAATLLSRTGLGYLVHRLSHEIPWLWRLHKVHHTDPHIDVSLGLRHHPLELLPSLAAFSAGTVLLGSPLWSVALVEMALIATSYSDHLDIRLPARAASLLQTVFVTPEVHRIHHSADRTQSDSNYGSLLILWDRLFGTYREPETETVLRYGLEEIGIAEANGLWAQLMLPFAQPARPLGRSAR